MNEHATRCYKYLPISTTSLHHVISSYLHHCPHGSLCFFFPFRGAPAGKGANTATPQIHHENLIPGFHVASEMGLNLQSYHWTIAIASIDFNRSYTSHTLQVPNYRSYLIILGNYMYVVSCLSWFMPKFTMEPKVWFFSQREKHRKIWGGFSSHLPKKPRSAIEKSKRLRYLILPSGKATYASNVLPLEPKKFV